MKFPGGEARTLKIRARLRHEDVELFPLFDGDADDAERRADTSGRKRAGVALGHDLAFARHELRTEAADGFVGGFLLEMNLPGFGDHSLLDFLHV